MEAPGYRCPYKIDPLTNVGIVCENNNCGAYDAVKGHCGFILEMRRRNRVDNTEDPNNT